VSSRLRLCLICAVQVLDFPGARFAFVNELHVVPETTQTPIPCYRVLDELGQLIPGAKYAQVGMGAFLDWLGRQGLWSNQDAPRMLSILNRFRSLREKAGFCRRHAPAFCDLLRVDTVSKCSGACITQSRKTPCYSCFGTCISLPGHPG
jgi:hypothetical protein